MTMSLSYAESTGTLVSAGLFGGNFLFSVNKNLKNFGDALKLLDVNGLRYPGGGITEEQFDVRNPNSPRDANGNPIPAGSFVSSP